MYFNDFEQREDILSNFRLSEEDEAVFKNATVLFASYTYADYSGNALVIYEVNGKYYEVHGSHCSCNGLEGQWNPEETSFKALTDRYEDEKAMEWFKEDHGADASAVILKILNDYVMEKEVLH